MQPTLTPKQQKFFSYLEREISRTGNSPSLRRAADKMGVSHAAISQLIRALEEKGLLKRDGRYSRTIHLLNRARETAGTMRWREVPIIGKITAGAAILDGDLVVCEPRQYAENGEIVVALINQEEATVKRFFLRKKQIELHPENSAYRPKSYHFSEVLVQGKVIGVQRGPEVVEKL
jgi:repressor LexA